MKYEKEYNQWLELVNGLRESWMTDQEWTEFYTQMSSMFSPEQFEKEVDRAVEYGYSVETQMKLMASIFKNRK